MSEKRIPMSNAKSCGIHGIPNFLVSELTEMTQKIPIDEKNYQWLFDWRTYEQLKSIESNKSN